MPFSSTPFVLNRIQQLTLTKPCRKFLEIINGTYRSEHYFWKCFYLISGFVIPTNFFKADVSGDIVNACITKQKQRSFSEKFFLHASVGFLKLFIVDVFNPGNLVRKPESYLPDSKAGLWNRSLNWGLNKTLSIK